MGRIHTCTTWPKTDPLSHSARYTCIGMDLLVSRRRTKSYELCVRPLRYSTRTSSKPQNRAAAAADNEWNFKSTKQRAGVRSTVPTDPAKPGRRGHRCRPANVAKHRCLYVEWGISGTPTAASATVRRNADAVSCTLAATGNAGLRL